MVCRPGHAGYEDRWSRATPASTLGWRSGFDFGLTLDYVYERKQGAGHDPPRALDRHAIYLNSPADRHSEERKG